MSRLCKAFEKMVLQKERLKQKDITKLTFSEKRVERKVLPPSLLYLCVQAVYILVGSKFYSKSNRPIFGEIAWIKENNVLEKNTP